MDFLNFLNGSDSSSTSDLTTIWLFFLNAGLVVKLTLLGLLLASIVCWTIIIEKWIQLRRNRAYMNRFLKVFWSGKSLEEMINAFSDRKPQTIAAVFMAAMNDWKRSAANPAGNLISASERIERVMYIKMSSEMEKVEARIGTLATIATTAPFIGLFGTVWGIMTTFQAIADGSNSGIAAVAPGIAEALLATAAGLFAAIPAAVGYNSLSAEVRSQGDQIARFVSEFSNIISRQLKT